MDISAVVYHVVMCLFGIVLGGMLLGAFGNGCSQPNTRIETECVSSNDYHFEQSQATSQASRAIPTNWCRLKGDFQPYDQSDICSFEYEGHTYLTRYRGGITHSESCKCKKESK